MDITAFQLSRIQFAGTVAFPLTLIYTLVVYDVFKGKTRIETGSY